jgi:ABC-type nitrate/sulfonate/bicarbonate transport system ATPase subunit
MYTKEGVLLKLDNVSLNYGEKKVLRDINLEVKDIVSTNEVKGQVTTVVGRSGIGKSQLFKIISGLLRPTTGDVLVGMDQQKVTPGMVGMVLQNYPLFAHYTLRGNLELVSKEKDKIDEYLNLFEIWDCQTNYPNQLSGGQRQRTAIVQQQLCSSHFILLDEPFSGLDPIATEKLCLNINKVANSDEQNTVLISSHILEPSLAISDSIWIIGNEFDTEGKKIPGATIRYNEDLAARGLAWNPDIRKDHHFTEMVEEVRETFKTI